MITIHALSFIYNHVVAIHALLFCTFHGNIHENTVSVKLLVLIHTPHVHHISSAAVDNSGKIFLKHFHLKYCWTQRPTNLKNTTKKNQFLWKSITDCQFPHSFMHVQ